MKARHTAVLVAVETSSGSPDGRGEVDSITMGSEALLLSLPPKLLTEVGIALSSIVTVTTVVAVMCIALSPSSPSSSLRPGSLGQHTPSYLGMTCTWYLVADAAYVRDTGKI